jgi:uncharacterized RDD family membrane protein YckC
VDPNRLYEVTPTTSRTTSSASYAGVDQLVTGEAVALELPPASLGLRIASGLIDVAVQFGILIVGTIVATVVSPDEALFGVLSIALIAFTLVVGPAVLETLTMGRTLGKLALGIRTVRDDAGPISFHHAFVRHLIGVIEIWVLSGVPALVCALVNSKGKRLGDLVAGTYVVRDRYNLHLPWPVEMPPYLARWAASADIGPLPDSLAVALRQLLGRTRTLSPEARYTLVTHILIEVQQHVSPPPPPGTHPEDFLAAVAAERRRRDEHRLWREADLRWRLTRRSQI